MQLGLILLLIEVALIVHAAKTDRFWPWGFIILFIPGFGALAYVLIELLPEWFGSAQGQQARRRVVSTLDPGRRYRELADQLQVADTIANRAALAEECLALGKFEEALGHYEHILALPMGDDAIYALGKHAPSSVSAIRSRRWRRSTICASAGRTTSPRKGICFMPVPSKKAAVPRTRSPSIRPTGAEARVRYGLLLAKAGRHAEAKTVLAEVLAQLKRAPKYVRRAQAEWIALAESALRDQVRA